MVFGKVMGIVFIVREIEEFVKFISEIELEEIKF